jgi:glutamate-1-semialdehyde 2,1-aminomutase
MMAGLQEAADRHGVRAVVQGYPQVWQIFFLLDDAPDDAVIDNLRSCIAYQDTDRYAVFQAALFERGVYVHPGAGERWFCSQAHGEDEVRQTLVAVDEAMALVKRERG